MTRTRIMALAASLFLALALPAFAQEVDAGEAEASPARKPAGRYVEPEPSVIPLSWQLEIKIQRVGRLVVAGAEPIHYWYVVYTVSNPANKPVDLMPRITMLTDGLEKHPAIMAISPDLFETIKDTSRTKYLEEPLKVNRVMGGADNARDTVAVFALKSDPKWFRVFFAGFSGEQWKMNGPGDEPGTVEQVTMEKVRVVEFNVPGNTPPDRMPVVQRKEGSEKWAMAVMPPQVKLRIDMDRARQGQDPVIDETSTPAPAPAPAPAPPAPAAAPAAAAATAQPAQAVADDAQ